jgi:hypothetical protein
MRLRLTLALLALTLILASSMLFAQRRASSGMGSIAKLIVIVNGESSDWGNWGFLWDAGERRNGRPWRPATGLLEPGATRSQASDGNKKIVYGITETAWQPAIGPTEVEILQVIADLGYQLVEIKPGAQHELIADDLSVDRATTYWFQRRNG